MFIFPSNGYDNSKIKIYCIIYCESFGQHRLFRILKFAGKWNRRLRCIVIAGVVDSNPGKLRSKTCRGSHPSGARRVRLPGQMVRRNDSDICIPGVLSQRGVFLQPPTLNYPPALNDNTALILRFCLKIMFNIMWFTKEFINRKSV